MTTFSDLQQLRGWKDHGKTAAVLFGRFQPLHKGHEGLIRTIKSSGLDVHIVLNEKVDTGDERNPYNLVQKREMFRMAVPELPPQSLHSANVYLGGGGDVGHHVRKLSSIFTSEIAPAEQLVICYGFKEEDRKKYLVDGNWHENIHYVDLLTPPRGPFAQQIISPEMIRQVTGDYLDIDAKLYRGDRARKELLDPKVASYLDWQHALAEVNGRKVGADAAQDKISFTHREWRGASGEIVQHSQAPMRDGLGTVPALRLGAYVAD